MIFRLLKHQSFSSPVADHFELFNHHGNIVCYNLCLSWLYLFDGLL
uniref:Uncharacterized protein n=1 Tax=Rhizophora mucronata TaxID=61149 RepID=A0A2P2PGD0_RHIMU